MKRILCLLGILTFFFLVIFFYSNRPRPVHYQEKFHRVLAKSERNRFLDDEEAIDMDKEPNPWWRYSPGIYTSRARLPGMNYQQNYVQRENPRKRKVVRTHGSLRKIHK